MNGKTSVATRFRSLKRQPRDGSKRAGNKKKTEAPAETATVSAHSARWQGPDSLRLSGHGRDPDGPL